jgi:hypothetical protein
MMMNKALISMVLGVAMVGIGLSQQYPPQYPQGQPPDGQNQPQPYPTQQQPQQQPQQQQYPPQGYPQQQPYPQGQPQYPAQYPQTQYPPAQGYPQQQYPGPASGQPPMLPPQQLDQLVASVALYPDGLLAHVLTAATFYQQIPEAAGWANQHAYLKGDALAAAIREDNLPWDVSVLALLPFPQVLSQMAQYMQWTEQLGDAVLAQRPDVMDAIQRLRAIAQRDGYFRDPSFTRYEQVQYPAPGIVQIVPVGPAYYVPYYNPQIFFVAPRPGFFVGFSFGPAIVVGGAFAPFGWGVGSFGFGWREHSILIGGNPWVRGWRDRPVFAARPGGYVPERRIEQHGYAPARREEHREEHREERRDHER